MSTIVGDVSDDCTVNVQGYAAQPSFQIRNCVERERERERELKSLLQLNAELVKENGLVDRPITQTWVVI